MASQSSFVAVRPVAARKWLTNFSVSSLESTSGRLASAYSLMDFVRKNGSGMRVPRLVGGAGFCDASDFVVRSSTLVSTALLLLLLLLYLTLSRFTGVTSPLPSPCPRSFATRNLVDSRSLYSLWNRRDTIVTIPLRSRTSPVQVRFKSATNFSNSGAEIPSEFARSSDVPFTKKVRASHISQSTSSHKERDSRESFRRAGSVRQTRH